METVSIIILSIITIFCIVLSIYSLFKLYEDCGIRRKKFTKSELDRLRKNIILDLMIHEEDEKLDGYVKKYPDMQADVECYKEFRNKTINK